MGIDRLKTYRLTCDAEISWKGFTEQCDATTTVQYPDKSSLLTDLKRNTVGEHPPYTGWHTNMWGLVICPRTDHITEDR